MNNKNKYSNEFIDWLDKYMFNPNNEITLRSLAEIRLNCSEELDFYIKSIIIKYE